VACPGAHPHADAEGGEAMEQTLVSLIHSEMSSCQSKQNWIVAAAFGLNSFIVLNCQLFRTISLLTFGAIGAMAVFSILSVWNSAKAHKRYADALRRFLKTQENLPEVLVALFEFEDRPIKSYSGSITFIVLILGVSLGSMCLISCQLGVSS
jgi:hypothetical protein